MDVFMACYLIHGAVTGKPPKMWHVIAEGVAILLLIAWCMYAFFAWVFR